MIRDISSLMRSPRPEMLIEGFIPRGGLVVVAAPAFTGKTYFALEMARAIGRGDKFLGQYRATRGRTLIVELDSPDWDLAQQYDKVIGLPHKDCGFEELEAVWGSTRFITEPTFALNDFTDAGKLIEAANNDRQLTGSIEVESGVHEEVYSRPGFDLIVIDTLRAAHQKEEKDDKAMQDVMWLCRLVATRTQAAVVVLHHFNKQRGEDGKYEVSLDRLRGSTAVPGAVDGVFALLRPRRNTEMVKVHVLKNRAAPSMRDFEYYQQDTPEGFVRLSLQSTTPFTTGATRDLVLKILREAAADWCKTGALYPRIAKEWGVQSADGKEMKSIVNRVSEALMTLERDGLIEREHGKARALPLAG